ncbi:hypothetical protein JTB14_033446 [Gonioctena quinquepunctata]|nr:hypothetical protein JTB14_033446 [Gonioctena quinquepunctata]
MSQVLSLIGDAYRLSVIVRNATNAFRATGMCPKELTSAASRVYESAVKGSESETLSDDDRSLALFLNQIKSIATPTLNASIQEISSSPIEQKTKIAKRRTRTQEAVELTSSLN